MTFLAREASLTAAVLRPFGALRIGGGFFPSNLDDLRFWYQSDHSSNTIVSSGFDLLYDVSGNLRHAPDGGYNPRAVQNGGVQVVEFLNSGSTYFSVPNMFEITSGVSVFIRLKRNTHLNGAGIVAIGIAGGGSGNQEYMEFNEQFSVDNIAASAKAAVAEERMQFPSMPSSQDVVEHYAFSIGPSSGFCLTSNGSVYTIAASEALFPGTPDVIGIGSRTFNQFITTPYAEFYLYEVGMYNTNLPLEDLQSLMDYMASRP